MRKKIQKHKYCLFVIIYTKIKDAKLCYFVFIYVFNDIKFILFDFKYLQLLLQNIPLTAEEERFNLSSAIQRPWEES